MIFFFTLFPVMEKCAKDQADGKCSRTSPYPPTVGLAPARIAIAYSLPLPNPSTMHTAAGRCEALRAGQTTDRGETPGTEHHIPPSRHGVRLP